MAKTVVDKAIEKATLIFVGEVARKLSKSVVAFSEKQMKKKADDKQLKKRPAENAAEATEGEEVID